MKTLHQVLPLQAEIDRLRRLRGRRASRASNSAQKSSVKKRYRVGFVPTMGALHRGHARLIREARRVSDVVVVSIFVNPLQFGPKEDLAKYPRTLAADLKICRRSGADVVFAPEAGPFLKMKSLKRLPADASLKKYLCGPFRPGHFDGVTAIVAHFFRIVRPDAAFFGLKDYQQYRVIDAMTRGTFRGRPAIVPVPTVREKDGLAMSSRNRYLSAADRKKAPAFHRALEAARKGILAGKFRTGAEAKAFLHRELAKTGFFTLQYAEVSDAKTLAPARGSLKKGKNGMVLAGAVFLGSTRLIDNVLV